MPEVLAERRRYPRADIDYRGVLETAYAEKVNLRARNISASGIFFDADKRLEEFTVVSLVVVLPAAAGGEPLAFTCTGVIVRVDENKNAEWPFSAAVHFTVIEDYHRDAISGYVTTVTGS
jgi:hypothetical protein